MLNTHIKSRERKRDSFVMHIIYRILKKTLLQHTVSKKRENVTKIDIQRDRGHDDKKRLYGDVRTRDQQEEES